MFAYHTHLYAYPHIYTHIPIYTYTHKHTCTHIYSHIYISNIYTLIYIHISKFETTTTQTKNNILTCEFIHIHIFAYTHIFTYTHKHTCTHIYVSANSKQVLKRITNQQPYYRYVDIPKGTYSHTHESYRTQKRPIHKQKRMKETDNFFDKVVSQICKYKKISRRST